MAMFPNKNPDRTGGVNPSSGANTGAAVVPNSDSKNSFSTFQTNATGLATQIVQSASAWSQVTFILETVGPVVIGGQGVRLNNGSGIRLQTGVPLTVPVARGERVYCAAGAVSRVQVIVHPLPWGEHISNLLAAMLAR